MKYDDILQNRFLGPGAVIEYKADRIILVDINEKFLSELWMNIAKSDYVRAALDESFDSENLQIFTKTVKKCIETGEEQECETWRSMVSNCCGEDKICLRSRLVLIGKDDEGAVLFEAVRNITNERRTQDTLADIESRYKHASEQINIYNWEYNIETREMRPCYRCMRDLGLPALVQNYPEPAIDMGIFPPDYADMYRDMMHRVDMGEKEIEADIPLTVGRIPFRVKYTTEYDKDGKPVKAFGSATLISETELGHIKLDNQIIATLAEEYSCIYMADFINDQVKVIKQGSNYSLNDDPSCKDLLEMIVEKLKGVVNENRELLSGVDEVRTITFKDCDRREIVY
nr:hypothetical protein [Lachnospiraceae bacterium]